VAFVTSLRCQKQFANHGHPGGAVAEQAGGDGALRRISGSRNGLPGASLLSLTRRIE
jgi:hypothetical protein